MSISRKKFLALWNVLAVLVTATVSYGQNCTEPIGYAPPDCCANAVCTDDLGCGDKSMEDGGLLQMMVGTGPYKYGMNQSYGFGLTESSRRSGAQGLFGLGGGSSRGYAATQGSYGGGYGAQGGYDTQPTPGYGAQGSLVGVAALATATAVPDMIGDSTYAGGGYYFDFSNAVDRISVGYPGYSSVPPVPVPAFQLSRLNMAEKFNAQVQNRVFADWRYFNSAGSIEYYNNVSNSDFKDSLNSNNVTFGFERLISPNASLEFRVPIMQNLSSKQLLDQTSTGLRNRTEWGNLSLIYKRVLRRTQTTTFAGGLGLNMPTACDYEYSFGSGNDQGLIKIENNAWRLTPYAGFQWHPNRRVFGHFLAQVDVPVSHSDVTVAYNDVRDYAKFHEQTLLRLNASVGRWFYRNERSSFLTGVGGIFEVHYTQALDKACGGSAGAGVSQSRYTYIQSVSEHERANVLNMVAAIPVELGKTTVMNAFTFPVSDQQYFDWEYNLSITRRF